MQFIQTYVSTCFYISPKRTSRGFGELPCRQQLIGLGRNKWIDSIQVVILQKHRSFTAKRERKGAPIGQFSTQYCCIYSPYYIWKHAVFRHSWGLVSCLKVNFLPPKILEFTRCNPPLMSSTTAGLAEFNRPDRPHRPIAQPILLAFSKRIQSCLTESTI